MWKRVTPAMLFFIFCSLPLCLPVHFKQVDASAEQAPSLLTLKRLIIWDLPGLGGG